MKTLLAGLLLFTACANAQDNGRGHRCSNGSLRGNYGFTITGTRPSGPPPSPVENFIGLAIVHFDGSGSLTQTYGTSHGAVTGDSTTDTGTGTYAINSDCSGTVTLNLNGRTPAVVLKLWVVVVDGGDQINMVVMTPTPNGVPVPAWNLTTSNGKKLRDFDD